MAPRSTNYGISLKPKRYALGYSDPGHLRGFASDIRAQVDGEDHRLGSVSGWYMPDNGWHRLLDEADAESSEACELAWVARGIENHEDVHHALLISRIVLEPEHRGHRLAEAIVDALVAALELKRGHSAVVLKPWPLDAGTQPLDPEDPYFSELICKVSCAYTRAGFEPYDDVDLYENADRDVWWKVA